MHRAVSDIFAIVQHGSVFPPSHSAFMHRHGCSRPSNPASFIMTVVGNRPRYEMLWAPNHPSQLPSSPARPSFRYFRRSDSPRSCTDDLSETLVCVNCLPKPGMSPGAPYIHYRLNPGGWAASHTSHEVMCYVYKAEEMSSSIHFFTHRIPLQLVSSVPRKVLVSITDLRFRCHEEHLPAVSRHFGCLC